MTATKRFKATPSAGKLVLTIFEVQNILEHYPVVRHIVTSAGYRETVANKLKAAIHIKRKYIVKSSVIITRQYKPTYGRQ